MDESTIRRLTQRWWEEVWRDGDLDVIDEILADPFVRHTSLGSSVSSRAEYKRMLADFQRVLCRPETTIDDQVVAGDRVWTRATSRGLNRETGEQVVVTWMIVQRIVGDRIAEHWASTMHGVSWGT